MTFGDLKNKIGAYLNNTTLGLLVGDWINTAMRNVELTNNWRCMERRAQAATSDTKLSLPNRYKEIIYLQILESGAYSPLRRVTKEQAYAVYNSETGTVGKPRLYATMIGHNEILVRPTPNKSYTYDMYFLEYTGDLVDDDDANWWTINAWDILLYGALLEAVLYLPDDARVPKWQERYNIAVDRLNRSEKMEKVSGGEMAIDRDLSIPC